MFHHSIEHEEPFCQKCVLTKEAKIKIGKENSKFRFHKKDLTHEEFIDNKAQGLPFYLVENVSNCPDQQLAIFLKEFPRWKCYDSLDYNFKHDQKLFDMLVDFICDYFCSQQYKNEYWVSSIQNAYTEDIHSQSIDKIRENLISSFHNQNDDVLNAIPGGRYGCA